MSTMYGEDGQTVDVSEHQKRSTLVRFVQSAGAILATLACLWFLFGIPAYLLFGIFFE